MNDILIALSAAGIFFGAMGIRGLYGYLRNNKVSDVAFDWRKFLQGSVKPILTILGIGALSTLIILFLRLVAFSGLEVAGLDQISVQTLIIGLFIADVGAIGLAAKEALQAFGITEKQIEQIRSTTANLKEGEKVGLKITADESGNLVASLETVLSRTVKEQLKADGVEVDHGKNVKPGKGDANTYVEPYRSAAPDSLVDPSTCYNRECVSYTACKIMQEKGAWPPRTGSMNAKEWVYRLPSWGYKEVSAPREGGKYVGVLPTGTYGHVVWFEYGNTISEYNYNYAHTFGMRAINLSQYRWFEITAPASTPTPTPEPTPTPDPVPTVPNNPTPETPIGVGESVIAWGVGTADSYGGGATTRDFPETTMKVIGINNGRYALNQYNAGTPGNLPDATGWFPASQVRK